MIQGVINRLGHDSFLIKGWSMAILSAGILFLARGASKPEWIILTFLCPVIGFWILDGYFLSQERLFRSLYDKIIKQEITDFSMDTKECKTKCHWLSSICSKTLCVFYLMEILFVCTIFHIFACK